MIFSFHFILQPSSELISGIILRKSSTSPINKRHIKEKTRIGVKDVPRFFWPEGKPTSNIVVQQTLSKAEDKLKAHSNCVNYEKFGEVQKDMLI